MITNPFIKKLSESALKYIYDEYLNVPIEELFDKIEKEEEDRNFENLNLKVTETLCIWLFDIYKDLNITKEDLNKIISSIEKFEPDEIKKVNGGECFTKTIVALQLDFRKEGINIGTYLIGYLSNLENKLLKLETKIFSKRDNVPNFARNKLLSEDNITLNLYNNKKEFKGSEK